MEPDDLERLLGGIRYILLEISIHGLIDTLLIAQVETNMVSVAIFKDLGDHVLYADDPVIHRLAYPLLDLWEEWKPGQRWAEMQYVVRGGKFETMFVLPGDAPWPAYDFERRDQIVRRYLGDKPIVYPPWEEGENGGWQFEL